MSSNGSLVRPRTSSYKQASYPRTSSYVLVEKSLVPSYVLVRPRTKKPRTLVHPRTKKPRTASYPRTPRTENVLVQPRTYSYPRATMYSYSLVEPRTYSYPRATMYSYNFSKPRYSHMIVQPDSPMLSRPELSFGSPGQWTLDVTLCKAVMSESAPPAKLGRDRSKEYLKGQLMRRFAQSPGSEEAGRSCTSAYCSHCTNLGSLPIYGPMLFHVLHVRLCTRVAYTWASPCCFSRPSCGANFRALEPSWRTCAQSS